MIGRAVVLGGWLGFVASLACGPSYEQGRCMPSNCNGCCDEGGICREGNTLDACGSLGGTCDSCDVAQACQDGTCRASTIGGEDGGNNNGTDGGTDGGNNGGCSPSNCDGCCRNGACFPGSDSAACGASGEICTTCMGSQSCESGACTAGTCQGCVDAIGSCHAGNTPTTCGAGGNACVECFDGQVCESGQCKNTTCSASNCNGCCQDNQCLTGDGLAACGTGGVACQACQGDSTCQAGTCTGGSTTQDGGIGFDAGFPPLCANCTTGCCDILSGTCMPGTSVVDGCGSNGNICDYCFIQGKFSCVNGSCQ